MISFRYHLVTIVAVFLALGVGVLMGTTVVKQGLISDLQHRVDNATHTSDSLRREVIALSQQLRSSDAFAAAAEPLLIQGRLTGQSIVVVATDGGDPSQLDGIIQTLKKAGATVSAVLVVTGRFALTDEPAKSAMADLLGLAPSTTSAGLVRQASAGLGTRLAEGPSLDPKADFLRSLASAGFLQVTPKSAIGTVGGATQPVVVLSDGQKPLSPAPQEVYVPLVTALVKGSHAVAAVETQTTANQFVGTIRSDGTVAHHVLTVDDADDTAGRIALVLGLQQMVGPGLGSCFDFGVKPGTCGLIPQPSPTP